MIPRYARPQMEAMWTPEARYGIWLEIETLAAEAMAELGVIPKEAAEAVRARGGFDVDRVDEIEREVVAISFNEAGVVENVERFGMAEGRDITISRRVTDSTIKGVSFLRQLFGSFGNFTADQLLAR